MIQVVRKVFFALAVLFPCPTLAQEKLVVHEWGTFTSLQDEAGETVVGINSDDEIVPRFTHDLAPMLIVGARVQGAPRCHPHVTMRLETPVTYFHLPAEGPKPLVVDVHVTFRGGWLTQFYPEADADAPGLKSDAFRFGRLTSQTASSLSWKGLRIGGTAVGPPTTEPVWTSPRAVEADSVTTTGGERERFLFYRGVGHIDAPLRVSRDDSGQNLILRSQLAAPLAQVSALPLEWLWLVEVRTDGTIAFRRLERVNLKADIKEVLATVPATFDAGGFQEDHIDQLRNSMHKALVQAGLFADEADALLNTWRLSYFQSAGLRLFFIVPPEWTDHYLPFQISVPAQIKRVMVGRIELITPRHREILRQFTEIPLPITEPAAWSRCSALYRQLGRFRNALVLDEAEHRPTEALASYIQNARRGAYEIP